MPNVTMMQVLVLRAIHSMPAGASVTAIHQAVREDTGVVVKHGAGTLSVLLAKHYITERRISNVRLRYEPIIYYSLTPAGRAVLRERSVVRMQVARKPVLEPAVGARYSAAPAPCRSTATPPAASARRQACRCGR